MLALSQLASVRAASKKLRVLATVAIAVSGCTETKEAPRRSVPRGGTLRVNIVANPPLPEATPFGLEPHAMFSAEAQEVFTALPALDRIAVAGGAS